MAPYGLTRPLPSVSFERKINFSVSQDLRLARSKYFTPPQTEIQADVWSIKPPDFSLKLYRRLSLPQRTERKKTLNPTTAEKQRTRPFLPQGLRASLEKNEPSPFITSSRPRDALELDLMFTPEPYRNPKPHNFRPLDEGLPDIVTTYERDPGNLNLKIKHLDSLRADSFDVDCWLRDSRTKMDTFKPPEPKWDARLFLPQPPWPPKSASYSRHRRRSGAYSALLDRVEEKLSRSWKNQIITSHF